MITAITPLIDSSLCANAHTRRQRLVEAMADDLVAWHAFDNEDDAFRSLMFAEHPGGLRKYGTFDVSCCYREAFRMAHEIGVVAREMGGS